MLLLNQSINQKYLLINYKSPKFNWSWPFYFLLILLELIQKLAGGDLTSNGSFRIKSKLAVLNVRINVLFVLLLMFSVSLGLYFFFVHFLFPFTSSRRLLPALIVLLRNALLLLER